MRHGRHRRLGRAGRKDQGADLVKIKRQSFRDAIDQILSLRVRGAAILECERLTGEWCVLVKVSVSDPNQITRLIDEMAKIPEVQGANTTLVLSTLYENGNRQGASGEAEGRNA